MITAVVLTHNEETQIRECLESVKFCDEIVVVDDYSENGIVGVLRELGKVWKLKIYRRHLNGDFSSQRNFGLEKTKGEWVLFVDPDERISPELAGEIIEKTRISSLNGYLLKRKDQFWGKFLNFGESANVKLLRLARRSTGTWVGKVHEEWKVSGSIGILENPLIHLPHPTIVAFISRINFYSTIRAGELKKKGMKFSFAELLIKPIGKFLVNYFFCLGFLDGIQGFIYAYLMSLHSLMVRIKLYDISRAS